VGEWNRFCANSNYRCELPHFPADLSMDIEVARYNNFPLLEILIYMNQQRHCLICFPTLWFYSNHHLRALPVVLIIISSV